MYGLESTVLLALIGGLAGEYVLCRVRWRWLSLFVPLATAMFLLQWSAFPDSIHIEWPGFNYANSWTSAFRWIRDNTPKDAVFALDDLPEKWTDFTARNAAYFGR